MRANKLNPSRRKQRGVSLIEALVAITIFSIGLMGVAGLQLKNLHGSSDAKHRALASMFAEELTNLAMADYSNAANYKTEDACTTGSACKRWKDKVASTLPGGSATVDYDDTSGSADNGKLSIVITWTSATDSSSTNTYTSISNLKAVQAIPE